MRKEKGPKVGMGLVKGDGQTSNGLNNRECHPAPKCPARDVPRSESAPRTPVNRKLHRPSFSSIAAESQVTPQSPSQSAEDTGSLECDQSFSTTLDLGGQFFFVEADILEVLNS